MAGRLVPAGGGASIPLTKRVMVGRRAYGCEVRLSDGVVSNKHCQLVFDGRTWTVQDLGSRNGTLGNGLPAKTGDTIVVAAKFRLVIESDATAERRRFAAQEDGEEWVSAGDDRSYLDHGPATNRREPHEKADDGWNKFG